MADEYNMVTGPVLVLKYLFIVRLKTGYLALLKVFKIFLVKHRRFFSNNFKRLFIQKSLMFKKDFQGLLGQMPK